MDVDHCIRTDAMAALIERLAREPARDRSDFPVPPQVKLESQMVQMKNDDIEHVDAIGALTPFTCPACHGALWEVDDAHVGDRDRLQRLLGEGGVADGCNGSDHR